MTDTPTSLYRKLADVMAEVGYVQKRGYNSFHKYHYVTEADLVETVRQKLAERNVVLIPSVVDVTERPITTDKGKQSTVTTVRVAFTFCDGDTGELHRADWAGAGDDSADKGIYKAYTGAMKYFLMKCFMIPTGDDPEADDARSAGAAQPATITDEQYKQIVAAYGAAGIYEDKLHELIGSSAPTEIGGTTLTVGQRVKLLQPAAGLALLEALRAFANQQQASAA